MLQSRDIQVYKVCYKQEIFRFIGYATIKRYSGLSGMLQSRDSGYIQAFRVATSTIDRCSIANEVTIQISILNITRASVEYLCFDVDL